MKTIEGYWYNDDNRNFPMPVENTIDQSIKAVFVKKLRLVESKAKRDAYMGSSICRLCKKVNGSEEYVYTGWFWPSGYLHYVEVHNVGPSRKFYEFIMGL